MNNALNVLILMEAAPGLEPGNNGFADITRGGLRSRCCLLMIVTVSKLHFRAQYHLVVLCLVLSCSLYRNYTGEAGHGGLFSAKC